MRLIVYVVLDLHIDGANIVRIFAESDLAHKFVKENASNRSYECLDIEAHEVLSRV